MSQTTQALSGVTIWNARRQSWGAQHGVRAHAAMGIFSAITDDIAEWCPCTRSNGCNVRTERKVGGGKINTKRILNAHNADSLTPSNCAAKACSVYSTETTRAGEWYLPNSTELDLMWENVIGSWIINYIDGAHWSSQAGRNSAWYQAFSPNGSQSAGSESKYEYGGVRAVRAF